VLRQQIGEAIQRAEAVEQRVEAMKEEAEVVNHHADNAFEELTVFRERAIRELEVQVARAKDEVEEETGRNFLYSLWMSHPEIDFSIFGDVGLEFIEEFKTRATSSSSDPIPPSKQAPSASSQTEPVGNLELPSSSPPRDHPVQSTDPPAQSSNLPAQS